MASNDDITNFLHKIAYNESGDEPGGDNANFNHKIIKSGPQKGQTAIGTYGLLPNTVDEVLNRSKDPNLKELKNMDPDEQKAYLESHPDKEDLVARHLAAYDLDRQGGDPEKAAFAWNQGTNLTPEKIEARDYQNSDYVKKFNKIADVISKKSPPMNIPGMPTDTKAPLDMGGTSEGDQMTDYVNKLSAKDMMQQHYADQSDQLKKAISLKSVNSNDAPVMHSEMNNSFQQDDQQPSDDTPKSLKFDDVQPNNPSLLDNAKETMGLYDSQVANRPRAAAMAALQGNNPLSAAIDNPPTSGEDIAKETFKTLNPEVTQTTNPSNVLMKQGAALAPAAPIAGMAVNAALDPMTYAGGAIGALKKLPSISDVIPIADQTPGYLSKLKKLLPVADDAASVRDRPDPKLPSRSFLQKSGPSAPNQTSRAMQLNDMDDAAKAARLKAVESYRIDPNSNTAKFDQKNALKAEDDFEKYKAMYGNGYATGGIVQPTFERLQSLMNLNKK